MIHMSHIAYHHSCVHSLPHVPDPPPFPTRRSSDLGDPVLLMAGERGVTPERHAELSAQLGYDKPVVMQYFDFLGRLMQGDFGNRSEEHTSELQSREKRVCRLLLEKKNKNKNNIKRT